MIVVFASLTWLALAVVNIVFIGVTVLAGSCFGVVFENCNLGMGPIYRKKTGRTEYMFGLLFQ